MQQLELQKIQPEHFEAHRTAPFEFSLGPDSSRSWKLEILEVSRFNKRRKSETAGSELPVREPFSVLFRNLESEPLDDQQLQRIRWADYEADGVFVSRVQVPYLDPRAMYYEIVFT